VASLHVLSVCVIAVSWMSEPADVSNGSTLLMKSMRHLSMAELDTAEIVDGVMANGLSISGCGPAVSCAPEVHVLSAVFVFDMRSSAGCTLVCC